MVDSNNKNDKSQNIYEAGFSHSLRAVFNTAEYRYSRPSSPSCLRQRHRVIGLMGYAENGFRRKSTDNKGCRLRTSLKLHRTSLPYALAITNQQLVEQAQHEGQRYR